MVVSDNKGARHLSNNEQGIVKKKVDYCRNRNSNYTEFY